MTINNLFIYFFPFVSFNSTADSSYHSRKRYAHKFSCSLFVFQIIGTICIDCGFFYFNFNILSDTGFQLNEYVFLFRLKFHIFMFPPQL
ncbi:hypothetical protein HanPI659440_Chr14g0557981 [Helianthus annuus]|nr:hypothetical protein HanPI659440_Chr14g0557981 [Helianthus annuus]